MVIETHDGPRPNPQKRSARLESGPSHGLASPFDRLAAVILDWFVVLIPVLVAAVAPLKRQILEALLLDTQLDFIFAATFAGIACVVVAFIYQAGMIYHFGATLGKLAFGLRVVDVWRQTRPSMGAAMVRAAVWIGEILLLGLPWLSVLSNPLRRTLHDKLSDTVVVTTRRPAVVGPSQIQSAFIHGIYAAAMVSFVAFFTFEVRSLLRGLATEAEVAGWLKREADKTARCAEVSDALNGRGMELNLTKRLESAMELFAAGLVDRDCVRIEAEAALNLDSEDAALAYLAMAFALSEEPERSNEYLDQVCNQDPQGEACLMSGIVQSWSKKEWDTVAERFARLPASASPHVMVWKLRYFMRQGEYELALQAIARLSGRPELASYLIPERVKALWRAHRFEEARLVAVTAFETLSANDRMNLSGWLCYEEMARQCSTQVPSSCEQLVRDVHHEDVAELEPTGWLAMALIKEKCDGQASHEDYEELQEASDQKNVIARESLKRFFSALNQWSRGEASAAREQLKALILDEDQPEALRAECLRRIIGWARGKDEIKPWIEHWEGLKAGARRNLGPALYRALKARGEKIEALKVGWKILDENRGDWEMNRDLVVTAYQVGRRRDAWALLKSYRERYELLNINRAPAMSDEFVVIARMLSKEFGEK